MIWLHRVTLGVWAVISLAAAAFAGAGGCFLVVLFGAGPGSFASLRTDAPAPGTATVLSRILAPCGYILAFDALAIFFMYVITQSLLDGLPPAFGIRTSRAMHGLVVADALLLGAGFVRGVVACLA